MALYYSSLELQTSMMNRRCTSARLCKMMPCVSLFLLPSQGVDTAALLRLYLNFDLLDAAAELVLEYVDALLGKGHQYFGIEVQDWVWAGLNSPSAPRERF